MEANFIKMRKLLNWIWLVLILALITSLISSYREFEFLQKVLTNYNDINYISSQMVIKLIISTIIAILAIIETSLLFLAKKIAINLVEFFDEWYQFKALSLSFYASLALVIISGVLLIFSSMAFEVILALWGLTIILWIIKIIGLIRTSMKLSIQIAKNEANKK